MVKSRLVVIVCLVLACLLAASLVATALSRDQDEQTIWKLEHDYWRYVQDNNLSAYLGLWHKDFLGWPSVSAQPVRKDHITDWITSQTDKGMVFKLVEFKPAAIQITDSVAGVCYWVKYKWAKSDGSDVDRTLRVTHTWIRTADKWEIIGGMSMAEPASPAK